MEYMKNRFVRSVLRIVLLLVATMLIAWIVIARPSYTLKANEVAPFIVSENDLKQTVIFLSQTALPRDSKHPENLNIAADYIKNKLSVSSVNVNFQSYVVDGETYKNVIASFGPDTKDIIVVGAHYDAFSTHAAADDNASGVAGLIELGKLLKKIDLKHRVLLVAYTLEEPPHYGSEHMGSFVHAASLHEKNVKLMISLEMIGYYTDAPASQAFPTPLLKLFYPSRGDFIAVIDSLFANDGAPLKATINKYTDLPAYSINAPRWIPGIDYSDHRNYWSHGYPAIMVTDTSFYRNHQYHQQQDTFEKLNYKNMAKVTYGVFKYVQLLDAE
jgi:Zn-dependent M28 family amino/carboxypeptidase